MKKLDEGQKENLRARAKVDIEEFEKGSMVGIQHMGSVADAVNRPIKVLDKNGKIISVFGKENKGEPLEVMHHQPNEKNPKGHFTLPNGKEPPQKFKSNGDNDCLFNVLAHQTGVEDPTKIRKDAANAMRKNIDYQAMQYNDVERLKRFKPKKLYEGGAITRSMAKNDAQPSFPNITGNLTKRFLEDEDIDPADIRADTYKNLKDDDNLKNKPIERDHIPPKGVSKEGDLGLCIPLPKNYHHLNRGDEDNNRQMTVTTTGSSAFSTKLTEHMSSLMGTRIGNQTVQGNLFYSWFYSLFIIQFICTSHQASFSVERHIIFI
jgi:hypothetical protein